MDEKQLRQNVIDAALELADATSTHGFTLPIPNTTPQLYVSLHEGPVQLRAVEDPQAADEG